MDEFLDCSDSLPKELALVLLHRKMSFSVAESCSGGLISHRITQLPGASKFFLGGVVAYSNYLKTVFLNVDSEVLDIHGAVSEPVALAMVKGVLTVSKSDIACAVTGVAGPGGGSVEKPVGLVYIAVASQTDAVCEKCHFTGVREVIKQKVSNESFNLVLKFLKKHHG